MPVLPAVFGGASVGERTLLKRPDEKMVELRSKKKMVERDKFARRVFAPEPSAAKRGRIGVDVTIRESFAIAVLALPAPRKLQPRAQTMEHDGKKAAAAAISSSCGTGISGVTTAGKNDDARILAATRRSEASSAEEAAAKRRKTSSPSKHAPEAARQNTGTEKQQYRVQRAAPSSAQRRMGNLLDKAQQALKQRRQGEIALAREAFRRELLEVEKAAMPDETIRPEDLQELGIAAFEYAVTRTRKQALARPG